MDIASLVLFDFFKSSYSKSYIGAFLFSMAVQTVMLIAAYFGDEINWGAQVKANRTDCEYHDHSTHRNCWCNITAQCSKSSAIYLF